MTLDDLRDQFAALQKERLGPARFTKNSYSDHIIESWAGDENEWETTDPEFKIVQAANVYLMARDYGISAAVLYKLQQTG